MVLKYKEVAKDIFENYPNYISRQTKIKNIKKGKKIFKIVWLIYFVKNNCVLERTQGQWIQIFNGLWLGILLTSWGWAVPSSGEAGVS